MFADAAREVRQHPGRIVATLVAIAISIAFMSGVSIFMETQSKAMGRSMALPTSTADLVVDIASAKDGTTDAQVRKAVMGVDGVEAAEPSLSGASALSTDTATAYASLYATPAEQFRWAELTEGAWPTKKGQVALSTQLAEKLGVRLGGTVANGDQKLTVVGLSDDPPSMFFQSAYLAPSVLAGEMGSTGASPSWVLALADGTDQQVVQDEVRRLLSPLVTDPDKTPSGATGRNLEVRTSEQAQEAAMDGVTGDFDVMKYALFVFSAIAAVVGLITIANTFTILLAQRRRQIGLLRAVGATGAQVRRRFLAEAVLLGMIGSALGLLLGTVLAWAGASYTRATHWGLAFPWGELGVEFLIGVVLTVLAAMLPALKATRVSPLEALQPVATSEQVRRTSIVRALVCGLITLAGAWLAWRSLRVPVGEDSSVADSPVLLAVGGSLLITIGVLFAAPIYIPWVLRALGRLLGFAGPSARLAASNSARNPRRAAATATALMLACGLIVALQVGSATAERTVLHEIDSRYPVDVQVFSLGDFTSQDPTAAAQRGLSNQVVAKLKGLPNVERSVVMQGGTVMDSEHQPVTVVALDPKATAIARDEMKPTVPEGGALTDGIKGGTKFTVTGSKGQSVTLTALPDAAAPVKDVLIVSPKTLAKLVAEPSPHLYWARLADREDMGATMAPLQKVQQASPGVFATGAVAEAYMVSRVLDTLLLITSALLGVAVLIALVGVGNTLGLSVLERTRESALLRALGMQRGGLRLMLLVEALLLGLAGVVVGVSAGTFFGWLGIKALLRQAGIDASMQFATNWPMMLGLIVIALASAAVASVLPGRRAANATPTEALAAD
ncbi:FtsX-like permease family protein [Luteococcus sediminum]